MFDAKAYWNKRLSGRFDLVGVGDISQTLNYNKWSYKVTRHILKREFAEILSKKQNKSVLDIGSGTGFIVDIWKNYTRSVAGIDISEVAVERLRKAFPGFQFYECALGSTPLPFKENEFSCISAASVLYHIVDDEILEKGLKDLYRVLEPDGIFIFSENFIHSDTLEITHQKCRTLDDYERLIQNNGFQIVKRKPNFVLFNDPVDTKNKWIKKIWGVNTSLSRKYALYDSIVWPALYPLEISLTSLLRESPSQEFMICRAVK